MGALWARVGAYFCNQNCSGVVSYVWVEEKGIDGASPLALRFLACMIGSMLARGMTRAPHAWACFDLHNGLPISFDCSDFVRV